MPQNTQLVNKEGAFEMNESMQPFTDLAVPLISATVFAILFTVILTTLRRAEVFPAGANVTLAICASLLAVIGILGMFDDVGRPPKDAIGGSWIDALLLPYTAMGVAILLLILLLLIGKVLSARGRAHSRITCRLPDAYSGFDRHDQDQERPGVLNGP